ncbi:hypothetical protein FE257_012321 [Aspergillus nanangensis]|uniref:Terpene synthase n=1 Tax=Aspergillus nanangensis TaxID=2582783 RepID=A0AAD4CG37_ASPNN|nr:hypothetical protein FE257_012321 [Aspergillus nanangensis]
MPVPNFVPLSKIAKQNRTQERSHQEFRRSIAGQKATLPNFYSLFPDWTPHLHPEYERARDEFLNPWIKRWVSDPSTARKFQNAEFGVFGAVMCARASFEKLCTVSKAFAWYFIWDDLFDCGLLAGDTRAAHAYREIFMQYFRAALCDKGVVPDMSDHPEQLYNALHCWDEVAAHMRQDCSRETLELLLKMKLFYISNVDTVDTVFHANRIPSLTQYWKRREHTAGVYPVIATIPFIYDQQVGWDNINSHLMRLLWRHTSYLVHMINDLFSLRKEIVWPPQFSLVIPTNKYPQTEGQIENMVPVLMLNKGIDCNQAMKLSFQLVQGVTRNFLDVESGLQTVAGDIKPATSDIFVEGCRNVVMGLTHWSYSGQRYFKHSEANANHEIDFHL